jgi:hypothetical protein
MRSSSRSKSSLKISHTILQVLLLKWHINFKKIIFIFIFTTSTYSILVSTIKISANFLNFLTPHQRSQRLLKDMFTFLKIMCTCELKGLGEWLLVVKKSKG